MSEGASTDRPPSLAGRARPYAEQILQALRGIRYGSVEIVIHDAKIVQIIRKERVRVDGELGP